MTPELEQQWREEFEKEWNFVDLRRFGEGYVNHAINMMWLVFTDVKKELDIRTSSLDMAHEMMGRLLVKINSHKEEINKLKNELKNLAQLTIDCSVMLMPISGISMALIGHQGKRVSDLLGIEITPSEQSLVACNHYVEKINKLKIQDEEISQLKEELKRERSAVDFYANKVHWEKFTEAYSEYDYESRILCAMDCIIEHDVETFKGKVFADRDHSVGGKLARQTQQQRRIEL